jgi:putative tricarboxylic transport membrane protein
MELTTALLAVFNPSVILFLFGGLVIGLFVGALPGLTATMALAVLTPLTFWFEPSNGFALLIGVWNSAIFAGGFSAILVNIPGTPASIAQTFDGYILYQKGKGGLALGINTIYSMMGGMIGSLTFIFLAFPIARFAVKFGASEFFMLAFFGLSMMTTVSQGSVLKGLIVGFAGILISTIGIDPMLALQRFTFNSVNLIGGISFLPVMIGMFGISGVLSQIFNKKKTLDKKIESEKKRNLELGRVFPTLREAKGLTIPTLLSSFVSTIIGAIPGTGGDISSIICWGQAKKMSKHPEDYGNGSIEGLAVASCANNAVIGGALTTMTTLGIPGDVATAVLMGSLMMYGMQPGPRLFVEQKSFVFQLMILMFLANLLFGIIGLLSAKVAPKLLNVSKETLWVIIILFCIVGSYSLNNNLFDVLVMFISGIVGFFFEKGKFPAGPFILGLLLGNMMESNLRRALIMSQGSLSIFVTRPLTLIMIILMIFTYLVPVFKNLSQKRKD